MNQPTPQREIGLTVLWWALVSTLVFVWANICPAQEVDPLLKWGTPTDDYEVIIPGHLCWSFDGRSRQAKWVLSRWTPDTVNGSVVRPDHFTQDHNVPKEFRPSEADYHAFIGCDIGHFEPFQNGNQSLAWAKELFCLTNTGVQDAPFNEGWWRTEIELPIHQLILASAETWTVTAPGFLPDDDGVVTIRTGGKVHLWEATDYTKAVLSLAPGEELPSKLPAWIVPNKVPPAGAKAADYQVTTDTWENKLGLNAWPLLPESLQSKLEAAK